MNDIAKRPKRPRPGSPLKFATPKMSHADIEGRLADAVGTKDRDLLGIFINQVVAAGELGNPSDDLEVHFLLSAIEDVLSNQSNGGVAKAMLTAQYAALHVQMMRLTRRFNRTLDLEGLEIIGRLLSSLGRTSVAHYEALTRGHRDVTVGHVSVSGGKAIVGSVTQNQRETSNAAPPQPLLTEAKAVPMPILEEGSERVPVPVPRTEESEH
jgi:hypothetical protein